MNIFQKIRARKPRKNKFDLSHERKFSFQMGQLTPIMVQDVLPGDKFRVKSEIFLRMAPMLAPIMHRVNVYTHYFFVPNRLLWNEWEDFITGGKDGTASPVHPFISMYGLNRGAASATNYLVPGSLADYLGLPVGDDWEVDDDTVKVNALPFRAYQLIYNEYYRDQNLTDPVDVPKTSGGVTAAQIDNLAKLRQRAWEKDYFTSALPWAQRGGDVEVPFDAQASNTINYGTPVLFNDVAPGTPHPMQVSGTDLKTDTWPAPGGIEPPVSELHNIQSIDTDIHGNAVNINELRRSIRLQEWLEKNARGGARYIEQILSHFNVRSSDARLQRPEYLGGGRQPVTISEVLSTFEDTGTSPVGEMAGHGVSVGSSNGFSRFFEEHGYVIGLISVLPKTAYQQGIPRHFSRSDKFDYAWPEFANIGEQEILNKELYFDPSNSPSADNTFGYTPRYAEYKYAASTVHGEMRDSLAFWHMGRIFSNAPHLNASFVESDPTQRIFAVQDAEQMYCQLYNSVSAIRPLPYFGTPTI